MFRFYYIFFITIILIYVLVLGYTMFTFFKVIWNCFLYFLYICICILNVLWQLNANGFSFHSY